jgi:ribonuclease P protein component
LTARRPGRLETLTRRADFLGAAKHGRKWATPGLILQARPKPRPAEQENTMCGETLLGEGTRVGFTASKKVGGAVARNRARRRLRALAREILANEARPGHDYVLIARAETLTREFADLRNDLRAALARLRLARHP